MFKRYFSALALVALLFAVGGWLPGSSASAQVVTTTVAAPTGLSVTSPSSSSLMLNWTAPSMASSSASSTLAGYNIIRNGTQVASTTGTSYTDTGLTSGTTYGYNVSAFDGMGNTSAWSATVYGTTTATSTATSTTTSINLPTGLSASVSGTTVTLNWVAPVNNNASSSSSTPYSFTLYRNGTEIATPVSGSTSYVDSNLTPGATYSYTISASDMNGNMSGQTAAVVVTLPSTTGTSTSTGSTTITPPANGIWGWMILPSTLYSELFNSTSTSATSTSPYTYVNGYPTINGNYYDCYGNIDNDMGHHVSSSTDTDPAHHVGQNCVSGSPAAPTSMGSNSNNSGNNSMTQWFFLPGSNSQWVLVPINSQTERILWQAVQ